MISNILITLEFVESELGLSNEKIKDFIKRFLHRGKIIYDEKIEAKIVVGWDRLLVVIPQLYKLKVI